MSNFVPFTGRTGPFQGVLPTNSQPAHPISGEGSPEGVVPGTPGQRYTDILSMDVYLKMHGTQELGWQLVGKTNTRIVVAKELWSGPGSPVGVVTPLTDEAIYTDTTTGQQWNWYAGAWH